MKLRKILSGAVATVACVAMLSTNVLAAVTVTPGANGNKLTVEVEGLTGQTTFLALDAGTSLTAATGDDIQYIDQADADELNIAFEKRASSDSNKVDLYVGNDDPTVFSPDAYEVISGVYVAKVAEVVNDEDIAYEATEVNDFAAKTPAEVTAFLADKVTVNYNAIGTTDADTDVILNDEDNASKFVFGTPVPDGAGAKYTISVTYDGIAAGSVTVAEEDPATITDITIIGIPADAPEVYVENLADFDEDMARAELAKITGLAAQTTLQPQTGDPYTGSIGFDKLGIAVVDGVVSFTYTGITIEETVEFDVIEIAPETVAGTYSANVNISGDAEAPMDAAAIEEYLVENYASIGFDAKYNLNKPNTTEAIPVADLVFEATEPVDGAEDDTAVSTVTVTTSATAAVPSAAVGTINVTINYAAKTVIIGSVTAKDTTGQVTDFASAIPVGAVVTAIKYDDLGYGNMGNYTGTASNFVAAATVVDASGNFELEIAVPGTYKVIVSHTKYEYMWGSVNVSKTILDENTAQDVTIAEGETKDLGSITLRYTYFGDLNFDGRLNGDDSIPYSANFGSTIAN